MKRSSTYQFTIDLKSGHGMSDLEQLRKEIKGQHKTIRLRGRLGYNNPNSVKYKSTDYRDIKLEDAQYADVYVYQRR